MPSIKQIQSVGPEDQNLVRWVIETDAVNKWSAKQKARAFARAKNPTAKNVFSPKKKSSKTKQTRFNELFTDRLNFETFDVEVVIDRPVRSVR